MLDWLRYFPLDLGFRKKQDYITPRGPYFPSLRPQVWYFGDSRFYFEAPWSNSIYGSDQYRMKAKSVSPGRRNLLADPLPSRYGYTWMPNQRWQHDRFYARDWFFVGPWFSGAWGWLRMTAYLVGQAQREDYKGASFFHPRVFETVIADFLSSGYGGEKAARGPCYRAPINWQLLAISPSIQASSFDIHKIDQGRENPGLTRHIMFPVSHTRFVHIEFNYNGKRLVKNQCDITPMFELNRAIAGTFRLEIGPSMLAQWEEVNAICPDMSLASEYSELKWPIKSEDVGNAQSLPFETSSEDVLLAEPKKSQ